MRIAKHILYYLSVPAAIVLWLGGYVLLDALIFPLENLEYLFAAILFIYRASVMLFYKHLIRRLRIFRQYLALFE